MRHVTSLLQPRSSVCNDLHELTSQLTGFYCWIINLHYVHTALATQWFAELDSCAVVMNVSLDARRIPCTVKHFQCSAAQTKRCQACQLTIRLVIAAELWLELLTQVGIWGSNTACRPPCADLITATLQHHFKTG